MDLLSSMLIFFQFGSPKKCAITESLFYHVMIIFSAFNKDNLYKLTIYWVTLDMLKSTSTPY